ncbi:hypothetical protein PR202_gb01350 [Eleusine coracana subsp. coracana]|uniref:Uncharacterized protein n=1 Tax=Eleusine coracana subsp. coracana TaxID=191504 RepID=A0AAV5DWF4_ELECO|nr:hypothetical protein PR202_gb01350 [Eleusine coracana subsp. coracana]
MLMVEGVLGRGHGLMQLLPMTRPTQLRACPPRPGPCLPWSPCFSSLLPPLVAWLSDQTTGLISMIKDV